MNNSEYSLKELYDVILKATYPIEIDGKTVLANETVAIFDKIQIANFKEVTQLVTAHGGYQDMDRVWWETIKEIQLNFSQGVFSTVQLALMTNSKMIKYKKETPILLSKRIELESDEDGYLRIPEVPMEYLFIYDKKTGNKITNYKVIDNQTCQIQPFTSVVLDYQYEYSNGVEMLIVGQQLTNGFFTLEGKTRIKDDTTGLTKTGVLIIPKLKLMSDLSIRLGKDATPVVGKLNAIACPVGSKGNSKCMELIFLNDDIDSDM